MNKACPVVIRKQSGYIEILAFKHPSGRNQIVKGTIEPGEELSAACERELYEEAGITAEAKEFLGEWDAHFENQVWGFFLMEHSEDLKETWKHFTIDGGGHMFSFFWQPLSRELNSEWNLLFRGAMLYIREALTNQVM